MNLTTPDTVPVFCLGCRLQTHPIHGNVILVPEGMIRLNETGANIAGLCNGERSIAKIATLLHQNYPDKTEESIVMEVGVFLDRLHVKRIVNYSHST
jgi:coenzyme PQQ biosynthesis protein PqqD